MSKCPTQKINFGSDVDQFMLFKISFWTPEKPGSRDVLAKQLSVSDNLGGAPGTDRPNGAPRTPRTPSPRIRLGE